MKRKKNYISLLCCISLICFFATVTTGQTITASDTINVSPDFLDINCFFAGGDLSITGNIQSAEDVIIEVTGKDSSNSFDLKGRKGPFWMTKGTVTLQNVPELYLLLFPDGQDWEKQSEALGMGIKQLKDRVSTSGTVDVPKDVFTMFFDLKKSEGLYDTVSNAISYSPGENGAKDFKGICHLPSKIELGTYEVTAKVVSNGIVLKEMKKNFSVREIGFIKMVDSMASNKRITYGVSAVIIALMAGLFMGVVFRQSGGSH